MEARISAITPSRRDASRLSIRVAGRAVATLQRARVAELGLEVGQLWDEALAARVTAATALDGALQDALRGLKRKPMSRCQVEQLLRERGHDAGVIDQAIARLCELRMIDDAALAVELLREMQKNRPAGSAMLRAKLEQRGLDAGAIDNALRGSDSPQAARQQAMRVARMKLKAMARLDPATQARRLWAALARRGFDEQIVEQVVREVTGIEP